MSQSTNAILFFGYCWHDEETLPDVEDFIECILKDRGMKNPYDNYPEAMIAALASYQAKEALGKKWREENNESIDAWFNAKAVIREELTCSIGSHCSGGCSMPYVCVNASETKALRGYPELIQPDKLTINSEWPTQLDNFMVAMGIEKPQDAPQWWLVSYWG